MEALIIGRKLVIPSAYLKVSYSRSSGPGGQNVNKLNTRVTIFFDVSGCLNLTDQQKQLLRQALKGRMDKQGVLGISCQRFRSQAANRNATLEQMATLIRQALKPKRHRKKTKIPSRAIEKRLQDKKARSKLKQSRSGGCRENQEP